jgi:hypothetical protein
MIANADLQVWLDSQPNAGQTIVIPYVRSAKDMTASFRIGVVQSAKSGVTRISQAGSVRVLAAQPTALSRLSLGPNKRGDCTIEVVLREGDQELGIYRFDCPR